MINNIANGDTDVIEVSGRPVIQNWGPGRLVIAMTAEDEDGILVEPSIAYEFPRSISETDGDNTIHLKAVDDAVEVRWIEV